jgi:hypothetical protein
MTELDLRHRYIKEGARRRGQSAVPPTPASG